MIPGAPSNEGPSAMADQAPPIGAISVVKSTEGSEGEEGPRSSSSIGVKGFRRSWYVDRKIYHQTDLGHEHH